MQHARPRCTTSLSITELSRWLVVLPALGLNADQLVHDDDRCRAIGDLPADRRPPFSVDDYRTLNRCLTAMRKLVHGSPADVRAESVASAGRSIFALAPLIRETKASAGLEADIRSCTLQVGLVDPMLRLHANRDRLLVALAQLLSNAFKFSPPHGEIHLSADLAGAQILIQVEDHRGGLLPGRDETVFAPFLHWGDDRSGPGRGLSIARRNVESDGGSLTVENKPGIGCVFTISLPNCTLHGRG